MPGDDANKRMVERVALMYGDCSMVNRVLEIRFCSRETLFENHTGVRTVIVAERLRNPHANE